MYKRQHGEHGTDSEVDGNLIQHAIRLLESVRTQGENDPYWNSRMGYSCLMAYSSAAIAYEYAKRWLSLAPDEMCIRDSIKIVVVVPFIGYDSKWPDQSRHRLKKLIQNANDSIVISHSADVSSYKTRNYYMVDHAEYLIGVFDNQKKLRSGTAQTVNYALHQGKVITLIHPDTMEITAPAP